MIIEICYSLDNTSIYIGPVPHVRIFSNRWKGLRLNFRRYFELETMGM